MAFAGAMYLLFGSGKPRAVPDVERRVGLVEARFAQRHVRVEVIRPAVKLISERLGEGIAALHQEPMRQAAQLNHQGVVRGRTTIVHQEATAVAHTRIDNEESGWQPCLRRVSGEKRRIEL